MYVKICLEGAVDNMLAREKVRVQVLIEIARIHDVHGTHLLL